MGLVVALGPRVVLCGGSSPNVGRTTVSGAGFSGVGVSIGPSPPQAAISMVVHASTHQGERVLRIST